MKKNYLMIKSLEKLSNDIYDNDSCIDSEEMANGIIESMAEQLHYVYALIERLDEEEHLENINDIEVHKARNEIDLYQIGDIINLLNTIKIKKEGK